MSETLQNLDDLTSVLDGIDADEFAARSSNGFARRPVDVPTIRTAVKTILLAIGEDPDREGLADTPRRVASWWSEFLDFDPGPIDTSFEQVRHGQLVLVSGVQTWSLCEHHLLPFRCTVAIGYLSSDRVVGLSKFARITHKHARRLQLQERLTEEIADAVSSVANTADVGVVIQGEHLCMTMRGVRTPATMTTSALRGRFHDSELTRGEFLRLATLR